MYVGLLAYSNSKILATAGLLFLPLAYTLSTINL